MAADDEKEAMSPLLKTQVEGFSRKEIESSLGPIEKYQAPSEVPIPLQQNIKYAFLTGVEVKVLAVVYDMPESWIELFVLETKGRA